MAIESLLLVDAARLTALYGNNHGWRTGTTTCSNGPLWCEPKTKPSMEICDGLDKDCDGLGVISQ